MYNHLFMPLNLYFLNEAYCNFEFLLENMYNTLNMDES